MRIRVLGGFVFALLSAPSVFAAPAEDISKAVERGVSYLKSHQNGDGTWTFAGPSPMETGHPVGVSALAGLALVESGVSTNDPVVRRAAFVVRYGLADQVETYDLSLAIMFLDRLGDADDKPMIEAATRRLLGGQTTDGGWSYTCPLTGGENEVRRLRTMADKKLRSTPDIAGMQRLGVLSNNPMAGIGRLTGGEDNSNTQFATFALWVARRHQLKVESALSGVERHFRHSQNADGGWSYSPVLVGSTASMTCAGLLGLGIGHGVAILRSRGASARSPPADFGQDPAVRRGLLFLGGVFQPALDAGDPGLERGMPLGPPPGRGRFGGRRGGGPAIGSGNIVGNGLGSEYYFLWSLERVAVVYALETIGNRDWYAVGSDYLLDRQSSDGSWRGNLGSTVDTCFALFFLRRANLARDLTVTLKGKVKDPGIVNLKSKPSGPSDEAPQASPTTRADPQSGQPAVAQGPEKPTSPKRMAPEPTLPSIERTPARKAAPEPSARTEEDPERQAHDLARIREQLVTSAPSVQESLLQQLRDGKGGAYTETLASAIPRLVGEMKSKARDALAERLTRMTVDTLRDKLSEDHIEIRSAAALACGMKDEKSFVPDLIPMLRDSEQRVARAAHLALKTITQQDFGMSGARWRDWWQKNGGR